MSRATRMSSRNHHGSPPPPPTGVQWGYTKLINHNDLAYCQKEYSEMFACTGADSVPRVDYWTGGAQGVTVPAAYAAGFTQLLLVIGATMTSAPNPTTYANLCVQAANENPNAYLELGNEVGINNWTPAQCVSVWNTAYAAIRNAGHTNKILMGSIAGGERQAFGRAGARQWCKELKTAGFQAGVSADWGNYHLYGDLVVQEQNWINYWTPISGESCQTILGFTEFALTEFNYPVGSAGGDENLAATKLGQNVDILKGTAGCRMAQVYAMSDDAGGTTTGYGLAVPAQSWRRRPSWTTFQTKAT